MRNIHPLKKLVEEYKKGNFKGIYSACSANEYVIEAFMERALKNSEYVLIEATANQVNQYGGYTGMKPVDFRDFVFGIAEKLNYPKDKIILGGDHLGPLTWKDKKSEKAMMDAVELIKQFVQAGFTKIHIDTSMHLGYDNLNERLSTEVIAERGAVLAETAEKVFAELRAANPDALQPVYVIGSEVPIPGGSQKEENGIQVTRVADFEDTVELFNKAFYRHGLSNAWENVIAIVVQPGVEFGNETIHEYNRKAAKELTTALKNYPGLVFEGHSTDYQTGKALKEMVEDGIAILKVGPALTFALREGLLALNHIENELLKNDKEVVVSRFIEVLEEEMLKNPGNWVKHYHDSGNKLSLARKYSYSDRCRYYLPVNEVQHALDCMINNLKKVKIPLTLISQYMPFQYTKIRYGLLENSPECLLKDHVVDCVNAAMLEISCLNF